MEIYGLFISYLIIGFGVINLFRIVFFMVGSDIYSLNLALRKKRVCVLDEELPTISVIIPAHNEKGIVLRAVKSILQANYPKELLQLIVVDDGSTDNTYDILKKFQSEQEYDFDIIHQENAGKAHALNNAIKNSAGGELVMCLDADSYIHPEALLNGAVHFLLNPNIVALSANVRIRKQNTLLNLIQRFEYLVCYQMKRAQTVYNIEYIIGGIGSMFRLSALESVGYYDTDTITEDIDLTMKFLRRGNSDYQVAYAADMIAYTESVLDISGLLRQRFRWKYGRAQTFFKNASLFFSFQRQHGKLLSWLYLPYALFSDIAFFFEPFMVSYLLYVVFRYSDWTSLLSAFVVVSFYIILNVLSEEQLTFEERARLLLFAPSMYLFFFVLSYVEYFALIKTYAKFWTIPKSIKAKICGWEHVERAQI